MAINNISAQDLKEMIEEDDRLIILDVRTPDEVTRGKIANSLNIPLDLIESVNNRIGDKNAKIVLYCLSGSRSRAAAEVLLDIGYSNIYNLENGLLGWRMKNFELV